MKIINEKIDLAKALCIYAHQGQFDKGGNSYYHHPFAVSEKMSSEDEIIAALLHDVIEDTFVSTDTIRNLFGEIITEAVLSLTRNDDEEYMDFIKRTKMNPIARAVKLADLEHNMDTTRLGEVTEKDEKRMEKYRIARKYLLGEQDIK